MAGDFAKAKASYEQSISLDGTYAPAVLNLGILYDLYLWDGARALELYDRYLQLTPGGDEQVQALGQRPPESQRAEERASTQGAGMKRRFFGHRHGSLRATMAIVGALVACGALAQDRAEIDRAQIIGNRELPKVLYIVPWKKPAAGGPVEPSAGQRARRGAGAGRSRRVSPAGALRRVDPVARRRSRTALPRRARRRTAPQVSSAVIGLPSEIES